MANRGMSEAEARARVGNQTSRESRTGVADFIIDNTGSVEELSGHVASLWVSLIDLCG